MKNIFCQLYKNYKKIGKNSSGVFSIDELLVDLKLPNKNIHYIDKKEAEFGGFAGLSAKIIQILDKRGIKSLYRHQTEAIALALSRKNFVLSTQTASGKTMCYNLPVLQSILDDISTTALYLFPTKALAHDQLAEFNSMSHSLFGEKLAFSYDGDTDKSSREKARKLAHVIMTNPDMLHVGLLPNHKEWEKFFANLKYVVVDELHTYRGVFGSHLANLFIRLHRICRHYGSHPTFICPTATIANPTEHAEALTGCKMQLVNNSTSGTTEKIIALLPPEKEDFTNEIRKHSLHRTVQLATKAISHGISTIVFARSRIAVEIILQAIRNQLDAIGMDKNLVMGYRSGYLPKERRRIEQALRSGKLLCVVSTNALELGIDIGSLCCAILYGFPPTIASTWQEIGRAGRRDRKSCAIIIATKSPKEQFFARNPHIFFNAIVEKARINSENPYILLNHVMCATQELPFLENEIFGNLDISDILETLAKSDKILKVAQGNGAKYMWQGTTSPTLNFSMRSATGKTYTIRDIADEKKPKTIGTMDEVGATSLLFPGAIYFHCGTSYEVKAVNTESDLCFVKPCQTDCYTIAQTFLEIYIANILELDNISGFGDATITITPSTYKKLDLHTHKILAVDEIHLPRVTLDTKATWIFLPTTDDITITSFTLRGLEHILKMVASFILMCGMNDVITHATKNDANFNKPTIYIIDNTKGGVGLAEGAKEDIGIILSAAISLVKNCNCKLGCPSCIGAIRSKKEKSKIIKILEQLNLAYFPR